MTQEQRQRQQRSLALQAALERTLEPEEREHRARLAELAQRRNEAIHAFDTTNEELSSLVLEAREAGLTITEIADVIGVSRQAVYALLERTADTDRKPRGTASAHVRGGRQGVRASFQIYRDPSGDFRWALVAANGERLADSPAAYATRDAAARAAEQVARQSPAAPVVAHY
jgi:uncharacterized protein YegP (UPF0339 family)